MLGLLASPAAMAQEPNAGNPNIVVNAPEYQAGPELKGVITARSEDRLRITASDGTSTVVTVNDSTRIKGGGGLLGGKRD